MRKKFVLLFFAIINFIFIAAQGISNNYQGKLEQINHFYTLDDPENTLTINQIVEKEFKNNNRKSPGITESTIWLKIPITNLSENERLDLIIRNPLLENVTFYSVQNNKIFDTVRLGTSLKFKHRFVNVPTFYYPLNIKRKDSIVVFAKIQSTSPAQLPIYLSTPEISQTQNLDEFFILGLYCGLMVIMFFYNLFLYLTTRDQSYFYYIIYIVAVGMAQLVLNGFAFKYFWPNNTWLSVNSLNLSGIFSGIATALFCQSFLQTRKQSLVIHRIFSFLILLYILALIFHSLGFRFFALNFINFIAVIGACFAIFAGLFLMKKDYRPAKYFSIAFSLFLLSVIIYVLRTNNVLPYNNFTGYILEIGSAAQIALLSLALADKINMYRREQSIARREALRVSKENERLVTEQNIILEKEVAARTIELENTNSDLNETLTQLKLAQAKLVDSEKMASLGQLTAGVAHEINNPINFVTSNIKPLELDIKDIFEVLEKYENVDPDADIRPQIEKIDAFKKEIDIKYIGREVQSLLSGIKEGAFRTAEIVKNLKNFVRLDQSNLKFADLNEGIDSTLVLVRNTFPKNMVLEKALADLPQVECSPGKINQVFMNIITNAVQAIKSKEYKNGEIPTLTIGSQAEKDSKVKISIKDNGVGMSSSTVEKIYEPFFTTKAVGEGTGLGMSIVKGIIESHHGSLEVQSLEGEGTEFILTLPIVSPNQ